MHIINIPIDSNKYDYVLNKLCLLQNAFTEYTLINCTHSPIDEFEYWENDGIYYREVNTNQRCQVNEHNYMSAYEKDNIKESGITLKEYVNMCLLFELDRIQLIPKEQKNQIKKNHIVFDCIATVLICPDGFNEIHIDANDETLKKIIISLG